MSKDKVIQIFLNNIKSDSIPQEMRNRKCWVCHNRKDAGEGWNTPANHLTFDDAISKANRLSSTGVSYVIHSDSGITCIDLDGCLDKDGVPNELARWFLTNFDSWTEVSISRTGLHIFVKNTEPFLGTKGELVMNIVNKTVSKYDPKNPAHKKTEYYIKQDYEIFCKNKAIAISGHVFEGRSELKDASNSVKKFVYDYMTDRNNKITKQSRDEKSHKPLSEDPSQEADIIRGALSAIPSDDYDTWFRVGRALKDAAVFLGDDVAKELWMQWSSKASNFNSSACNSRWAEPSNGSLTIATILRYAKCHGWKGMALSTDGTEYRAKRTKKPQVELHGVGGVSIVTACDASAALGKALSTCREAFCRGGSVVSLRDGKALAIDPHTLAILASRHAELVSRVVKTKKIKGDDGKFTGQTETMVELLPTNATSTQCADYLAAREFWEQLPTLNVISKCPVITGPIGRLQVIRDYDAEYGIYSTGGGADEVPLDEAIKLLQECLADFDFATPSDKSRALAALITPALVMGGLIPSHGRAPIDFGEADKSQSGKGFRQKLVTAIYNDRPLIITQKAGGTGSMEESYSAALISGACFISFDNLRGKLDCPMIESSLTEDMVTARMPYGAPMAVDMRRVCVSMTSNNIQLTKDLGNRSSRVEIRKRPDSYRYKVYPEGNIVAHISKNQAKYLGAVFAVVKAWDEAGRPLLDGEGHDFRSWAGCLDWMAQKVFQAAPLRLGMRESVELMSNPHLGWLREVILLVAKGGFIGKNLRTYELVQMLESEGSEIPGVEVGSDLSNDVVFRTANQSVGRKLGKAFDGKESVTIDDFVVQKVKQMGEDRREISLYNFAKINAPKCVDQENDSLRSKTVKNTVGLDFWEDGKTGDSEPNHKNLLLKKGDFAPKQIYQKTLIAPNAPNDRHPFSGDGEISETEGSTSTVFNQPTERMQSIRSIRSIRSSSDEEKAVPTPAENPIVDDIFDDDFLSEDKETVAVSIVPDRMEVLKSENELSDWMSSWLAGQVEMSELVMTERVA